jgi:hypothetical protein
MAIRIAAVARLQLSTDDPLGGRVEEPAATHSAGITERRYPRHLLDAGWVIAGCCPPPEHHMCHCLRHGRQSPMSANQFVRVQPASRVAPQPRTPFRAEFGPIGLPTIAQHMFVPSFPGNTPRVDRDYVFNCVRAAAIAALELAGAKMPPRAGSGVRPLIDNLTFAQIRQGKAAPTMSHPALTIEGRPRPWLEQSGGSAIDSLAMLAAFRRIDLATRAIATAAISRRNVDCLLTLYSTPTTGSPRGPRTSPGKGRRRSTPQTRTGGAEAARPEAPKRSRDPAPSLRRSPAGATCSTTTSWEHERRPGGAAASQGRRPPIAPPGDRHRARGVGVAARRAVSCRPDRWHSPRSLTLTDEDDAMPARPGISHARRATHTPVGSIQD